MEGRSTIQEESKKSVGKTRIFVPVKYLIPSLAKQSVYIHPMGDGITLTQEEFRDGLKIGSIKSNIIPDLQFKVF